MYIDEVHLSKLLLKGKADIRKAANAAALAAAAEINQTVYKRNG